MYNFDYEPLVSEAPQDSMRNQVKSTRHKDIGYVQNRDDSVGEGATAISGRGRNLMHSTFTPMPRQTRNPDIPQRNRKLSKVLESCAVTREAVDKGVKDTGEQGDKHCMTSDMHARRYLTGNSVQEGMKIDMEVLVESYKKQSAIKKQRRMAKLSKSRVQVDVRLASDRMWTLAAMRRSPSWRCGLQMDIPASAR